MINRFAFILILLLSLESLGQTEVVTKDFEFWSTFSLDKKLDKLTHLKFEQSVRMFDNSSKLDQYFTNLSLENKVGENSYLDFGLRYLRDRNRGDTDFDGHMRFNVDFRDKIKINRLSFKYRFRVQASNELGFSKSEGDFSRKALRLRGGLGYNIKNWKLDPQFSGEIFREFGKYMLSSYSKYRINVSTKYKFNKDLSLKLFFRIERELNVSYPATTFIGGFNLTFNL